MAKSGAEGIVANAPLTRESPGLPAGRAEHFPVQGELYLRATSVQDQLSWGAHPLQSVCLPVSRCLDRLPEFRRFFQIEALVPVATPPSGTALGGLLWL